MRGSFTVRGPVVEGPPEIGSEDSLAAYFASRGKVFAIRPGGEAEEVGTALTANGGELERFDVALGLARKQREAARQQEAENFNAALGLGGKR